MEAVLASRVAPLIASKSKFKNVELKHPMVKQVDLYVTSSILW